MSRASKKRAARVVKQLTPKVTPTGNCEINGGNNFNIQFLNTKGEAPKEEDILTTCYLKATIDGLDSNRIKSILFPKLDVSSVDPLILDIEYYPFKLRKFGENK